MNNPGDGEKDRSHLPRKDSPSENLLYKVGVGFAPSSNIEKHKSLAFISKMAEYFDPESIQMGSDHFEFDAKAAKESLRIEVATNEITISVQRPSQPKEWFEDRIPFIVQKFADCFEPRILIYSSGSVTSLLPIDGDARVFLGGAAMQIPPGPIDRFFKRPLHLLGMRLFFPPFEINDSSESESSQEGWGVNIKIESWMRDPSKLFLEVEGRWQEPDEWSKDTANTIMNRFHMVGSFAEKELLDFLHSFNDEENDENDKDNTQHQ